MVHQPSGGAAGQASDIAIHAQEILKTRKILNDLYVHHTGQPLNQIEKVMERDYFMSAQEALQFGLVDKVIEKRSAPNSAAAASSCSSDPTPKES